MTKKIEVKDFDFFNTATFNPEYSFKVRVSGGKWMNVAKNGKPLTFATKEDRDNEKGKFLEQDQ